VGGHIVRAFGGVAVEAIVFGSDAAEELIEVVNDVGVGILLNGERGGGVLNEDGQQAGRGALFREPFPDRISDFVQAFAAGVHLKAMHEIQHPSIVCRVTERIGSGS
jgi:hypothetical protein